MRNKRHPRGLRGSQKRKVKPNYAPVIVILCLSIGCGYATAKYVVEPVVNYAPQVAEKFSQQENESKETINENIQSSEEKVIEDRVETENSEKIRGYALQFGCYSDNASASSALSSIGIEGLTVIEQDSMYKIVGEIYAKKDEARAALEKLPEDTNAFVTTLYE